MTTKNAINLEGVARKCRHDGDEVSGTFDTEQVNFQCAFEKMASHFLRINPNCFDDLLLATKV